MSARRVNRRVRLLVAVFTLAFGVVLVRAGWLQAVQAGSLDRLAASQHREAITIPAHRGTIYDRTGVELAIGERAITVYANPQQIENPRAVALAAGRTLGDRSRRRCSSSSPTARRASSTSRARRTRIKAEALRRQNVIGLGFYPEERRAYPLGDVAAEIVGYAGVDNRGLAGLELGLDKLLGGSDGKKTIVRDPFGHRARHGRREERRATGATSV